MTIIPPMPEYKFYRQEETSKYIKAIESWGTAGWAKAQELEAEFRRDGLWFSKAEHDALKTKLEDLTTCRCGDHFAPDYRGICPGCQSAETASLRAQIDELEWQITSQARCDSWQVESL